MANPIGARKSSSFKAVSTAPSFNKTPVGSSTPPLPYPTTQDLSNSVGVVPSVHLNRDPAYVLDQTTQPQCKGDDPGVAKGVKSGTVNGKVFPTGASTSVRAGHKWLVREGDPCLMNGGNNPGVYVTPSSAAASSPQAGAAGSSPLVKPETPPEKSFFERVGEQVNDSATAAAKSYKGMSESLHDFAGKSMSVGGTTALAGAATAGVGGLLSTTVVGAPVGAVMAAGGGAVAAVGGGVTAAGSVTETVATGLDAGADYVLAGKLPDGMAMLQAYGQRMLMNRLGKLRDLIPGKKKPPPAKKEEQKNPADAGHDKKGDGATVRGKGDENKRQAKDCCPQNTGPGNVPTQTRRPIHLGSGEEILHHTDFECAGLVSVAWTRCYRSSHAGYDHGPLGARWTTPFTTRFSVGNAGIVYHDADGRTVHLPLLEIGESVEEAFEGFTVSRADADRYRIAYIDGTTDTFTRPGCVALQTDVWPLGSAAQRLRTRALTLPISEEFQTETVECFYLSQILNPDGRSLTVRYADDDNHPVLLDITDGAGLRLQGIRSTGEPGTARTRSDGRGARIGAMEQILNDGKRVRLASYRYEPLKATGDPSVAAVPDGLSDHDYGTHTPFEWMASDSDATGPGGAGVPESLPASADLVAHEDALGQARSYGYQHHLLTRYTTFGGYAHRLQWQGIDALYTEAMGTLEAQTSHWARAVHTFTDDGAEPVTLRYEDPNTTLVTHADGSAMRYVFDGNNLCVGAAVVAGAGMAKGGAPASLGQRTWDGDGNLAADTDAAGATSLYTYDQAGNPTVMVDANGATTRVAYGPTGKPERVVDALGHVSTRTYDARGLLLSQTDALGRTTRYRYDEQGQLVEVHDALDKIKRLEYVASGTARGQLARYTDCSGNVTQYSYTVRGWLERLTEAAGTSVERSTRYSYDLLGRITSIIHPGEATERFTYDADSNLVAHANAAGHVTHYRYNGAGQPVERIDANGAALQYRYNQARQLTTLVNQNGEETSFTYDAQGRLVREVGFDGKATDYCYDPAGHLTSSSSNGQRTAFSRDLRGQLIARLTAQGIARYAYDPLGRLTAVATGANSAHIAEGRTIAQSRFTYDAAGQLVEERHTTGDLSATAQAGICESDTATAASFPDVAPLASFLLRHDYDALGHRIRTRLPDGAVVDTLRYGSGHWHGTLYNGRTVVDIERDALHRETGRSLGATRPGRRQGQTAPPLATRSHYDPQDRLRQIILSRGPQTLQQRDYGWSEGDDLLSIVDSSQGRIDYRYDPLGQLLQASRPDLTERFAFDPAGNMLDPLSADSSAPNMPLAQAGRALPAIDSVPDRISADKDLDSLTDQPLPGDAPGEPARTRSDFGLPRVTHNLLKTYLAWDYDHDMQGNTIRKVYRAAQPDAANQQAEPLELRYDADNRLVQAIKVWEADTARSAQTGTVRQTAYYTYDAFGRRIAKRVVQQQLGIDRRPKKSTDPTDAQSEVQSEALTLFVWDGDTLLQEVQHDRTVTYLSEPDSFVPLARIETPIGISAYTPESVALEPQQEWVPPSARQMELDKQRSEESTLLSFDAHVHRYWADLKWQALRQQEQALQLQLAQATNDARIHHYQCDHLGTPQQLIDGEGHTAWAVRYRAWGRIYRQDASEVSQPIRFQGQYEDEETGLFYNRYRFYDPDSGRYLTQDPIGLNGGENLFRYAPNPNSWIDPLGLAKYVVIGEGQASVEAYAAKARLLHPCDEFRTIASDWTSLMKTSGASEAGAIGSAEWERVALQGNANWIKSRHNEGYQFIDIGTDSSTNRSPFYKIEKETLTEVGAKVFKGNKAAIADARTKSRKSNRPAAKTKC